MPHPKGVKIRAPRQELIRILNLENRPEIVESIKKLWTRVAVRYLRKDQKLSEQKEGFRLVKARLEKDRLFSEGDKASVALHLTLQWLYQGWGNKISHHRRPGIAPRRLRHRSISPKKVHAEPKARSPSPTESLDPLDTISPLKRQPEIRKKTSSLSTSRTSANVRKMALNSELNAVEELSSLGRHGRPLTQLLFNCSPSMTHILPVFERLGVSRSEEYLFSISTWAPQVVHEFLEQVAETAAEMGIILRSIDLFVLRNAFLTHFL